MLVKIEKSEMIGKAEFPSSKSFSHRLIIAAALGDGVSIIKNVSKCDDVMATISSLSALGAKFSFEGDSLTVIGIDIKKAFATEELYVNESGSTLRFLIPIAWLTGKEITLRGAQRLFERPLGIYADIAKEHDFKFELERSSLTVCGKLKSGTYRLPGNVSSQFITGLMFALPLIEENSKIIIEPPFESRPYIDMTIDALASFGVQVKFEDENTIAIEGNQRYSPANTTVEGDWSGGAFLLALKMLHEGIDVCGFNDQSLQGDRVCEECFNKIKEGDPTLDITDCPDLGPILFAMAAYFNGATFTGTKRLKIKESDRASAMKTELEKLGTRVDVFDDTVRVYGGVNKPTECIFGHNDHRIVMAMATLLSKLGGSISGAEAIKKSYPEFFEVIKKLNAKLEIQDT